MHCYHSPSYRRAVMLVPMKDIVFGVSMVLYTICTQEAPPGDQALIIKPLKPPRSATPASHCNQPRPLPHIPEREVQAAAIKSAPLWSLRRCHKRRSSCSAWSLFSERRGIRPASTPTCGCCEPAACAKQDVSVNVKGTIARPSATLYRIQRTSDLLFNGRHTSQANL